MNLHEIPMQIGTNNSVGMFQVHMMNSKLHYTELTVQGFQSFMVVGVSLFSGIMSCRCNWCPLLRCSLWKQHLKPPFLPIHSFHVLKYVPTVHSVSTLIPSVLLFLHQNFNFVLLTTHIYIVHLHDLVGLAWLEPDLLGNDDRTRAYQQLVL